ncbi:MAG TPA: hypothetical protein VK008_02540 [Sphingobacteriaceae bacterium]|nr:hypothetical protein [Sphingobacteriaceae bacterium]
MSTGTWTRTREMVLGALLAALAIIIPIAFQGTLQFQLPPFTATLASHVPSMLAMFISPTTAAIVGLGSTFGFLVTLGPVVAARAFTHVIFGVVGAYLYRRGWGVWPVLLAVLPIHALAEGAAVHLMVMVGFQVPLTWVIISGGTAVHHMLDAVITWFIIRALTAAGIQLGPTGRRPVL